MPAKPMSTTFHKERDFSLNDSGKVIACEIP